MAQPALPIQPNTKSVRRNIAIWIVAAFGAVFVGLALLVYLGRSNPYFRSYRIPSGAMKPTFLPDSTVLADLRAFKTSSPKFGDVIVFKPIRGSIPNFNASDDVVFISRCVGESGDQIEVRSGELFRNGEIVTEPYVSHALGGNKMAWDFKLVKYKGRVWPVIWEPGQLPNSGMLSIQEFWASNATEAEDLAKLPPVKVPPGFILTMGDNREESSDGRMWGPLPITNVIGRVLVKVQ